MLNLALNSVPTSPQKAVPPVERRIRAFLSGETNGQELFQALYDHVLEEPIPQSMRDLLKR